MEIFSADFFIHNRQSLRERLGSELIVLTANGQLQRSADTTYPFRQDSNFWYLTGINQPDYIVVINGTSTFLIAPKRGDHRDLWDGAVTKESLRAQSGIEEIEEHHTGWLRLDLLIKKYKKVHTIVPTETYYEDFGFYANPARYELVTHLRKHRKIELVDIRKTIAHMRQLKQPEELQAIKEAIAITTETLRDIQQKIGTYSFEYELAADIIAGFIRRGAKGHAYQPIVASGNHAATIHYFDNDGPVKRQNFLLLDVGAEVQNYSADITRTYIVGTPTKRQKQLYASVLRVKQAAEALIKPGILMKEYEQAVDTVMAEELVRLGLIDDAKDKRKLKKYYPHLTSHFLGLDTHDAADYFQPLAAGMVLTVEPGIYVPEEGIGIRIEDDILVTETGMVNLSADLPVTLL